MELKFLLPGKDVVQNAIDLDSQNGNTLWRDLLAKEMGNLMIAFEILEPGQKAPPGWFKATGHIIFDLKMDFTRKARWVKDGYKDPDSTTSSYAGVVSRESIRIVLTYAGLLRLPVLVGTLRMHTFKLQALKSILLSVDLSLELRMLEELL